jgi:hypothetical protein
LEVTYAVKEWFFDGAAVAGRVEAQKRKRLSQAGAYVRRTARTLLRRKKTSAPGQPPATHGPEPNLRTVLFAYDPQAESLVVGPVKLPQVAIVHGNRSTVPELMERGGIATIYEERYRGQLRWRRRDMRRNRRPEKEYRRRRAVYQPRPFMGPALDRERTKLPELFRNCIGP